ncbi:tripartite tricarboxylate transporter TctB family protein [Rhodoplanes sp. SY1]|uniref:tripartite tricarboxylate transporter TctB family protein n=1 Tax=Rhodoplanes sp. SY1 TaxID=3166646 RepID=UPI0038B4BD29
MKLRRDTVAGAAFVALALLLWWLSDDLPVGSLAMPGAGMMPMIAIGLVALFGAVLLVRGASTPPITAAHWSDADHAVRVIVFAALATALYTRLGVLITMSLLLFGLVALVERRGILRAAVFAVGVTVTLWAVFGMLLKSPLPTGSIWS